MCSVADVLYTFYHVTSGDRSFDTKCTYTSSAESPHSEFKTQVRTLPFRHAFPQSWWTIFCLYGLCICIGVGLFVCVNRACYSMSFCSMVRFWLRKSHPFLFFFTKRKQSVTETERVMFPWTWTIDSVQFPDYNHSDNYGFRGRQH